MKLTLARPKTIEGLAPAVICIHGGGWVEGDRSRWQAACEELARRGFVAVTVQYRLAKDDQSRFPAAVEDVQAAVRWLRANADRLKIDPDRIGALGDSAGGHLAQCLGVGADEAKLAPKGDKHSSRVNCIVNIYGPNNFTDPYPNPNLQNVLGLFHGGDLEHLRHQYIEASPYYWVTPDAAPTLIIHGTRDDVVPYEQGTKMFERLKEAGVDCELLTLEGAGHGFQGADGERADAAMYKWLEAHLKAAAKK